MNGSPQVLGHEARSEVLTAAHKLLGGVPAGTGALGKRRELIADRIVEVQLVGDVEIALADVGKQVLAGNVVVHVSVYEIQQVGDLGVGLGTASARTHHHEAACRVGVDNRLDLAEMLGVGDGRTAKFGDLDHGAQKPLPSACRKRAARHDT